MQKKLILYFYYALYWYLFFIINKVLFLIYHYSLSGELGVVDWFAIILHGSKLDIATIGYIIIIPALFFILSSFLRWKWLYLLVNIYTYLLLFFTVFLCITDIELYSHWGFRLDTTALNYINTPKEMFASTGMWIIVRLLLIAICLFAVFAFGYYKIIGKKLKSIQQGNWKPSLILLIITGFWIIFVRGGFGIINLSSVYFHKNNFVNHASVNLIWNVSRSIKRNVAGNIEYKYFDNKKAKQIFNELYSDEKKSQIVIKSDKPNIIIIILESFTSDIIEVLGGREGITPNFNKLSKEGILFNNFYASGNRTADVLPAILSGYPAHPDKHIILYPEKIENIPHLSKDLKEYGYQPAFYYGGDIDFSYMRSYLIIGQFNEIISKENFKRSESISKWGVPDHIVFDRFFKDINDRDKRNPFFKVLLTLSSHSPYDVPMEPVFDEKIKFHKFLNSVYYTDKCLGQFVERVRNSDWWDNTWLIILSDHGCKKPGNHKNYSPEKFKIPMLWLGGAINKRDTVITNYASETDIAKTILEQLDIENNNYLFSKNILSPQSNSFAYYSYNSGFGFISDTYSLVYDINTDKFILKEGNYSNKDLNTGKAYLQVLNRDFLQSKAHL